MNLFRQQLHVHTLMMSAMMTAWLAGCAGLTRPYPQKDLFAISLGDPPAASAASSPTVLRVAGVRIARPYDDRTFVYKTGESSFTTDYYNGFIAEPDRLLTSELTAWLSRSGLFSAVIGGSSVLNYDLTLETNVTALYGDYSAKGSPKAVVEARFFLVDDHGGTYKLLLQKVFNESEPLPGDQPEQLIQGWDRALRRMLEGLDADLRVAVAPTSRPAS
jgi:cholesterol transport system auxiliary component